jgi:RNA polymerase sigma-70 factor (sigma-E family)
MKLAWTADSASIPAETGNDDATPALRRLSEVWDRSAPKVMDRDDGIRLLYERRHADMVRFAAFLTGDVNVAEDIAHDAFAKVFDAWDRIDDRERLDAYLKATVVNVVRGRHRRQQISERRNVATLTVVPSAEDDAIVGFRRQRTLDAVAALPIRQRACVVMRHWMRMSESEIADTLELSVGSVRTHVKRGMESLKNSLGEQS